MKVKLVKTKNPQKIPKILRKKSEVVQKVTPELFDLAKRMVKIMIDNKGIGISAIQVGVPIRMMVINDCDKNLVFINPELKKMSRQEVVFNEGCLSFPDIFYDISRPEHVTVKAKNLAWEDVEVEAEGLFARCLLHELDHLEGILFVDKI